MPVSTTKGNGSGTGAGFDADMFRKLVALFDSDRAGEVDAAFRKTLVVCTQNNLRFSDAIAEAYGLADMQDRLEQREQQGEQLADALDNLRQEFAAYRQKVQAEVARLRVKARPQPSAAAAGAPAPAPAAGVRQGRRYSPKLFLVMLWALLAARLALVMLAGKDNAAAVMADSVFFGLEFMLLVHWAAAEQREGGPFLVKLLFVMAAHGAALACLMSARDDTDYFSPPAALACCSILMVLLLSRFCAWVSEGIASFARHPARTVRRWFA